MKHNNQTESSLRAFIDATPTVDLLKIFAECGIMVRIVNVKLSKESTPQRLVYRPSFSVSFGYEGREILQLLDEPDLNQAFAEGIQWLTEHAVSNAASVFAAAIFESELQKSAEHYVADYVYSSGIELRPKVG